MAGIRQNVITQFVEIMGEVNFGLLNREIGVMIKRYKIEDVNVYLFNNLVFLRDSINRKDFKNDYNKIRYCMAIVYSNIDKFLENYNKEETEKVVVEDKFEINNKRKNKNKRRGLNNIE